jgi:hypothetical protein
MSSGSMSGHNLFVRLFSYYPRKDHSPEENFLTEAFAYVLATDPGVQGPLIEALTGGALRGARVDGVETQALHEDESFAGRCIPDAVITGKDASGQPFELWLENKWHAPWNDKQILLYDQMITGPKALARGRAVHLAFVAGHLDQVKLAKAQMATFNAATGRTALAWSALHEVIAGAAAESTTAAQFAEFLSRNGLGAVDKITLVAARAFASRPAGAKVKGETGEQAGLEPHEKFKRQLQAMCASIIDQLDADRRAFAPDLRCHVGYGRVSAMSQDLKVSIGFLYDVQDHRTSFLDPDVPLDICARIQADPAGVSDNSLTARREAFTALREELEEIGFDCDPDAGRWRNNKHTVVLGQYRPGMPWDVASGVAQAEVLSDIFARTGQLLSQPKYKDLIRKLPSYP